MDGLNEMKEYSGDKAERGLNLWSRKGRPCVLRMNVL